MLEAKLILQLNKNFKPMKQKIHFIKYEKP